MLTISKHVVLVGLMGTGKSTIGKDLAGLLGVNFIDTDQVIEQTEGRTISDVFSTDGEAYFRYIESNIFKQILAKNEPSIIATGGGIVLSEENRIAMKNSYVIRLNASPEEIYGRVFENKNRPLLANSEDIRAKIINLSQQREPLYKKVANYTVNTDDKDKSMIVEEIISLLKIHSD